MVNNRYGYTLGYTILGRKEPAVTHVESTRRRPQTDNGVRATNHHD